MGAFGCSKYHRPIKQTYFISPQNFPFFMKEKSGILLKRITVLIRTKKDLDANVGSPRTC